MKYSNPLPTTSRVSSLWIYMPFVMLIKHLQSSDHFHFVSHDPLLSKNENAIVSGLRYHKCFSKLVQSMFAHIWVNTFIFHNIYDKLKNLSRCLGIKWSSKPEFCEYLNNKTAYVRDTLNLIRFQRKLSSIREFFKTTESFLHSSSLMKCSWDMESFSTRSNIFKKNYYQF